MDCEYETDCYMRLRFPRECCQHQSNCDYAEHVKNPVLKHGACLGS